MNNQPIWQLIPAVPFLRIVRQYAIAHGLNFFTLDEQLYAAEHYCLHAKYYN
jgi:hypothetical protein